jgi:hypothetical protein
LKFLAVFRAIAATAVLASSFGDRGKIFMFAAGNLNTKKGEKKRKRERKEKEKRRKKKERFLFFYSFFVSFRTELAPVVILRQARRTKCHLP